MKAILMDPTETEAEPKPKADETSLPVSIKHVDKTFGNEIEALRNVNLDIQPGEFVSLLGPSGCGKSTLLKIIAGLSEPSFGQIRWWGENSKVIGNPGRELCFVFQEPTLMPWRRVMGNVRLPLDLAHQNRAKSNQKVQNALNLVGLDGFENVFPRQLSGGMQMRVSLARALVTEPNLCLFDEPFGALDEITRDRLNDDILKLWEAEDWTVTFVTHSVFEAVYLSTRIVVMGARPGRIVEEFHIDAPYPRGNEFRRSQQYMDYCRKVSAELERVAD